ncbi:MAG TPA: DUF885 domain-containing protein, partial [Allosphingosinicella sp.]|nr:DUF885 domain-containing protein [Allosphingosinicella sp.]
MILRSLILSSTALLAACVTMPAEEAAPSAPVAQAAPPAAPAAAPAQRNAELAAFFEAYDKAELAMSPMGKAYRGIKDADYGKWDDFTDAADEASRQLDLKTLAELRNRFPRATLSPADQLSYDIFESQIARGESLYPFRKYDYVFDQMNGAQSQSPAFLINIHRVASVADAEAYVSRLSEMARALRQATEEARRRQALGILPPKWVFPYVIADSRNLITGAPFGSGKDSPLWADFKGKVAQLDADAATKQRLLNAARAALLNDVRPAYQGIITLMQAQQRVAGTDDGIWRSPNGAAQYQALLKSYTTTDYTADQIHELGLAQVARIHSEMSAIKDRVGFNGSLQDFFAHMRTSKEFYYPNTDAGRQMYLDESQ